MDVGTLNAWELDDIVPSKEILDTIRTRYDVEPANPNYFGEVASRYVFTDGTGEIGFISSVTQPFCSKCTRARLSAYGSLYTCLFASAGVDLRGLLRHDASDEEILKTIHDTWSARTDRYSEERAQMTSEERGKNKVEMYSIGG
jgi:cyclic pyranopterin phosphate synthase